MYLLAAFDLTKFKSYPSHFQKIKLNIDREALELFYSFWRIQLYLNIYFWDISKWSWKCIFRPWYVIFFNDVSFFYVWMYMLTCHPSVLIIFMSYFFLSCLCWYAILLFVWILFWYVILLIWSLLCWYVILGIDICNSTLTSKVSIIAIYLFIYLFHAFIDMGFRFCYFAIYHPSNWLFWVYLFFCHGFPGVYDVNIKYILFDVRQLKRCLLMDVK